MKMDFLANKLIQSQLLFVNKEFHLQYYYLLMDSSPTYKVLTRIIYVYYFTPTVS